MKILQVYQIFNPQVASGVAKVAFEISKELVERGHEVVFCASDMKDKFTRGSYGVTITDGITVHRFNTICPFLAKKLKVYITPKFNALSCNLFRRFDVVHLHGYRSYQNIISYVHCKRENIPYIVQAHGTLLASMAYKEFKLIYDTFFGYRLLRDASKLIALSQTEAEQYRDMDVSEEKITIIPNGIGLLEYAHLPPKRSFKKKFGIDEDEKLVLYLGRIHRIKGIDILVKAFADVVGKLDDVKLVIVGPDDGYLGELEALIKAMKMEDDVLILGPLYGKDKLEAYVDTDVYVLPSRYETFPMTLLEVYACAKPVVASKVGKSKDLVIDNVTGLSVEPENAEHLASAILYLLNNDDKAEEMGLRGKQFVKKNFAIEKVVDRLERLYEDIIGN